MRLILLLFCVLISSPFFAFENSWPPLVQYVRDFDTIAVSSKDSILVKKTSSNVQSYTPSSLLQKGQIDLTLFNSLYTQDQSNWMGTRFSGFRESFYSSLLQGTYGISKDGSLNAGIDITFRSSGLSSNDSFSKISRAFDFENNDSTRNGLSSIAFRVKILPFKSIGNLSIESSFSIPLIENAEGRNATENLNGLYFLDWERYIWWNRLFYDRTFNKWQLFSEADLLFRIAKDTDQKDVLDLPVSVFLSYFPNDKSTIYIMSQHVERIGFESEEFGLHDDLGTSANYTTAGFGGKYQVTDRLNLELLYTNFVRSKNAGLGETFNLGLKYIIS